MRLESVVVRGVAHDTLVHCQALESLDRLDAGDPEWLFDEHVLAVLEQIGQDLFLRLIRNAA